MEKSNLDKRERTRKKAETTEISKGKSSEVTKGDAGGAPKTPARKEGAKTRQNESTQKEKERKKKTSRALKKAVKKQVEERNLEIAASLVDGIRDGNKSSRDLVNWLMEMEDGAKKKKKEEPTAAELLGSEDQWESESFEAMEGEAELGIGRREPEGNS